MNQDKKAIIKLYYDCYANNDLKTLQKILTEDLIFTSSYSTYNHRDTMLEEIWPAVIKNKGKVVNLEIFENNSGFMVKYDLQLNGMTSMSEYFRFEGEKIAEIEVFIGTSKPIL